MHQLCKRSPNKMKILGKKTFKVLETSEGQIMLTGESMT